MPRPALAPVPMVTEEGQDSAGRESSVFLSCAEFQDVADQARCLLRACRVIDL